MFSKVLCSLLLASSSLFAFDAPLPQGIVNDQHPDDKTISPQEALEKIAVPDGFEVTLFAGEPDLSQPIAFTFDDRGRLWVVQNFSHPYFKEEGHDRILIFEDKDGDGQFDEKKVFWDKGQYVTGIQYGHGGIWICNSPKLQFIPDKNGDDIPDSEPITVLDGWNIKGKNNVFNNLNWGPDGWLYGCIGQNGKSHVAAPEVKEEDRGFMTRGIWRYHPTRKKFEVVARGAVNPWGLDFDDYGEGFFTNCVLPHAWHLIPGAYYLRRSNETDYPNIYGRIPPIADHIHWAGGHWTSSRSGKGIAADTEGHSDHGGGHAHTGCMIYLGDNWPAEYRGNLLVGNIHGNRINKEFLKRQDSSYVASHGPDFLRAYHPWFRSLSQKYGPDGGVYISDWHDYGECHDHDGTHRTSGRIYKVTYGKSKHTRFNLTTKSNLELVRLQLHKNEWFSRHARRILQERAHSGNNMSDAHLELFKILKTNKETPKKLRALWCLNAIGTLSEKDLLSLLEHKDEHLRAWSIRFLMDNQKPSQTCLNNLKNLARSENASLVRLHLASQLQKLSSSERLPILIELAQRSEDQEDRMIPKMLYYASMKLVDELPNQIAGLVHKSQLSLYSNYLSRLLITQHPDQADALISDLSEAKEIKAIIEGMYESLIRQGQQSMPPSWPKIYAHLLNENKDELSLAATQLALKFKDPKAAKTLERLVLNSASSMKVRLQSLQTLIKSGEINLFPILEQCLDIEGLKTEAIQAMASLDREDIPKTLFSKFDHFNKESKAAVFTTLCSRESYALKLFEKIANQSIPSDYLNSFHIRQLKLFKNEKIQNYIRTIWGEVQASSQDKEKELHKYKKMLNPRFLSEGDSKHGKKVYARTCGACHKLFGEGGVIGPDLTGSGRKDLHYLLENIIDPSRIVNKNYQLVTITMNDQRIITGTIAEENDNSVTISSLNENILLKRDLIKNIERSKVSIMPEGLLNALDRNQLRDLIAYLQK